MKDTLAYPNPNDENNPYIKTLPAGKGREEALSYQLDSNKSMKNNSFLLFIVAIITFIAPWWIRYHYQSDLMFTAFFLGGMMFLAGFAISVNMGVRMFQTSKVIAPKVIVDNFDKKQAQFFDATGAHAGALLGDVLHDPFQSGGLGTPANQRVVVGMIHKAHKGVLFIDEIATLHPRTQQEMLSALQEKIPPSPDSLNALPARWYGPNRCPAILFWSPQEIPRPSRICIQPCVPGSGDTGMKYI